ncbi:MAG: hypothetical protein ACRD0D_10285 [Acidimicrobiales bacterium]
MSCQAELKRLQGQRVSIALVDGSRIDDCTLVSAGRAKVWVFSAGADRFVPLAEVVEVWEPRTGRAA